MKNKSLLIPFILILISIVICVPVENFARQETGGSRSPEEQLLRSPIRLALIPGGDMVVSDYQTGMILLMKGKTQRITRRFAVKGKPLGIAYAKGNIYVGNEATHRIEVYNRAGKMPGGFVFSEPVEKPTDIAVDTATNSLFVVDGAGKVVKVFSLKGNSLGAFPALNPDKPVLANPTGIALDEVRREVYVSDYGDPLKSIAPRVQIFDYTGNLVGTISGKGSGMLGAPKFSRPQGLAVDESARVFLVDCYAGEVLVFDRFTGTLLKTIGSFGTEPGELQLPLDIVINPATKDLFLTNNRAARIEIFLKGGQL
jgi:DNA-binding beta-propeller fold protein YncE